MDYKARILHRVTQDQRIETMRKIQKGGYTGIREGRDTQVCGSNESTGKKFNLFVLLEEASLRHSHS
jgi:hypothetical protein